ncbi:MAG TPA: hypothetical protein VLL52_06865, partial [Anaerolineae bacterium]|nr:hypothetical protein [Anaerolineae bacterium]
MMDILWRGQKGYERLLGVTGGWAEGGGFVLVETERRHEPEWANWVLPIWFLRWGEMRVCSVAPDKRGVVERLWPLVAGEEGLLGAGLLAAARAEVGLAAEGWHGREILAYLGGEVWLDDDWGAVAWLTGDSADGYRFLNYFDGGVGVLRSEAGEVMSYVGVKDKGV